MRIIELSKGLWNIYKPKRVTSFDVVRGIKKMTGEQKVGHAGTLDPLAEGVLVVGIGREATKKLRFVLEEDKEYIAEIKLGMNSETDDEEGVKSSHFAEATRDKKVKSRMSKVKDIWPSLEEVEKIVEAFVGDIVQVSPVYSAIKIGGERAYKKARRREKFTRPPRIVTIKEIEILDYQLKDFEKIEQENNDTIPAGKYPVLKIRCVVGSGTYIRSLAREIGEKLETGGYLISLVRIRIGDYKIKEAINLKN